MNKRFSDLSVTTMVCVAFLDGAVKDIQKLFEVLPCPSDTIVSMKYCDMVKGNPRTNKKSFRNSVTIELKTNVKNVNLKVAKDKIHICGVKSILMAEDAINILLSHINRYSDLVDHHPLSLVSIHKVMINYNYDLGFKVNRWLLSNYIKQVDPGFQSDYDNTVHYSVIIKLPIDNKKSIFKSKKRPYHTFIVYKSGLVTQSGPDEILMEIAYNRFMNAISNIKDMISLDR